MRLALIIPPGAHSAKILSVVALSVARKYPNAVIYSKWETLAERQMQHQLRRYHVTLGNYTPQPELPRTAWGWIQGVFRKQWSPLDEVDGILVFVEKGYPSDKLIQQAVLRKKLVRTVRLEG